MNTQVSIRLYNSCDKPAVRKICSDTADLGRPVENFFYDREVFADLVIRYYTDFEPRSLWVADHQGRAAGYLSGCLDSRRYMRIMLTGIIPGVFVRAALRGAFWRRDTWQLLKAGLKSLLLGSFNRKDIFDAYPAHLHINLEEAFRHQGLGAKLIERFLEQLRQLHLSGVHASVCQDNRPACVFFERLGFSALGRYPMMRPEKMKGLKSTYTVIYGKSL
ncbi:MAG: GNAT family N-acetyltransferase [Candidatus Omnitrophica bacterium]|nr:GNAT family N-acetyltransferase [Candidatus Omnitrophota bacterium]